MKSLAEMMDRVENQKRLSAERKRVVAWALSALRAGRPLREVTDYLEAADVELTDVAVRYGLDYDGKHTP